MVARAVSAMHTAKIEGPLSSLARCSGKAFGTNISQLSLARRLKDCHIFFKKMMESLCSKPMNIDVSYILLKQTTML